jgi:hypothetical protein
MAHWRKTPEEMRALSSDDLEVMEFAFLLLERRQSETLDVLFGNTLGTSWDAATVMGQQTKEEKKKKPAKAFTWSYRKKQPRVYLPLTMALTQDPKFHQNLKRMASQALNEARENPSVVDTPTWMSKKTEVVDLSYVPKEEFIKFAGRIA